MICNGSKWIISTRGGLELLQMVSKLVISWCGNEDVEPTRSVDSEISHISSRRKRNIFYTGIETSLGHSK